MGNNTHKPDLFDRFIDRFSARKLKTHVWAVVLLGILLIGIAIAGGVFLATRSFHVADKPGLESVPFIDFLQKGAEK
jgi:hypothetical protein